MIENLASMALGKPGSEIQAPMALVVLFGLLSSTVLNMLVVPALCALFGSIGRGRSTPGDTPLHATR